MWSSSKSLKYFNCSGMKKFDGFSPLFVQYRKRSSVRGGKSINKWQNGTDVASLYQSRSNKLSPTEHWAYQLVIHLAVTWIVLSPYFLLHQFSGVPWSYKLFDKNHQNLLGTRFHCSPENQQSRNWHPEQIQCFRFPSALHRKAFGNGGRKTNFYQTLVWLYHFSTIDR